MKTRAPAILIVLFILSSLAAAQVDNCCYVDRQCSTDRQWTDGYFAFQNGQCAAPAQSQPTSNAPAQVDNCCFVDRQCSSDQQWTDGYWAFQWGQCAVPVQSVQPAPAPAQSQPATNAPANVDNCCGIDRQCHSDWDWVVGFYAFRENQCPVSAGAQPSASAPSPIRSAPHLPSTPLMPEGVKQLLANPTVDPFNNCCYMHHNTCHSQEDWSRGWTQYQERQCIHPAPLGTRPAITGDHPKFTKLVNDALHLISVHAPEWLPYIDNSGALEFRLMPLGGSGGFYNQSWTIGHEWLAWERDDPNWHPDRKYVVGYAGGITHEACHAIKQRTYTQSPDWTNEADCEEARLAVIEAIWPESPDVGWLRASVADYHRRAGIS